MTQLIETLDKLENLDWSVELVDAKSHFVLQSVKVVDGKKFTECQLWVKKKPLQITAVRLLQNLEPAEAIPVSTTTDPKIIENLTLPEVKGCDSAIVWDTIQNPLYYWRTATILCMRTSVTSRFMGFGEQGGQHLFKNQTFMNYFSEWIRPNMTVARSVL